MSKKKATKSARTLISKITDEGGRVLDTRNQSNHWRVDYTFDNHQVFTATVPYAGTPSDRHVANFVAQLRRNKRSIQPTRKP